MKYIFFLVFCGLLAVMYMFSQCSEQKAEAIPDPTLTDSDLLFLKPGIYEWRGIANRLHGDTSLDAYQHFLESMSVQAYGNITVDSEGRIISVTVDPCPPKN